MSVPKPKPLRKFVRAGAGAGKTWNLTREVVHLALEYRRETGQWPKTVLTTFTRKATQELKERMVLYCLEEKPEALEFVQSSSFLNITTMHGLLSGFLSRYGHGIGLPSNIRIIDQKQALFWKKQILRNLIVKFDDYKRLQFLDFKTLLESLQAFEEVYWLGDSKPLATTQDFQNLYNALLAEKSVALSGLVEKGEAEDPGDKWEEYFTQLRNLAAQMEDPQDWGQWRESLAGLVPVKRPRKSKDNPGLSKEFKAELDPLITSLKSLFLDDEHSPQYWENMIMTLREFNLLAGEFMKELFAKKQKEGALEPNDLEFYSLKLLREHPDLVEKFSQDYEAWFIDEFQDTSPLQMKLLEPMIAQNSCYIVGDPQQSIYLFRGSRSEVFFEKAAQMRKQGAQLTPLEDNYRSQENLLEFFNSFFPALKCSFTTMNPKVSAIENEKALTLTKVDPESSASEIELITDQLARLLNSGVLAKNICILTRTHRQSDKLQKKLMSLGFPVISHSSDKFYQRREILDGLSILKFLINPWDDKNLLSLMRSPWVGLEDKKIIGIIGEQPNAYWKSFEKHFKENKSFHAGQLLLEGKAKVESFGYGWAFRRLIVELGLLDFSNRIDSTGRREANLWKLINMVEKNSREPGSSLLRLISQGEVATSLEELGAAKDASSPVEPNKVHLMTYHASKGLQFDYVFLPFLEKKPREKHWQNFTSFRELGLWSLRVPFSDPNKAQGGILETIAIADNKIKEREESLRLFYVGATRARKKLFLSWTGKPKKNSWAESLESHRSTWENNIHAEFNEISEIQPAAFEQSPGRVSPGAGFDPEIKRIQSVVSPDIGQAKNPKTQGLKALFEQQTRRRQGVVLHKVFENLKHFGREELIQSFSPWLPGLEKELKEAIDYVTELKQVPMATLIQNGYVEWGYRQIEGEQKTEKRVDLWGTDGDTLWVIDYKTGSPEYKDAAFEQMKKYAQTLKQFNAWTGPIKMGAIFPFSKQSFVSDFC